jgi:uncharacterized protein YutD
MCAITRICYMKTNQVLTRRMGDFDVLQRTKDGMFNTTVLVKRYSNIFAANGAISTLTQ